MIINLSNNKISASINSIGAELIILKKETLKLNLKKMILMNYGIMQKV